MPYVALVTGASAGIGEATARRLAREPDVRLVLVARRQERLQALADELGGATVVAVDLTSAGAPEAVRDAVEREHGELHLLVNNAGLTWGAPAESMPLERWQQVIDANITGTFLMSQAVGRHMLERNKGAIVNVASIACLGGGQLNTVGYNASKAAVINLTRALAVEWGPRNIRINCIAPGMFRTRRTEAIIERGEAIYNATTPMGRIGKPGEIAPTVLFLVSEGANYITGQVVAIDGGRTAQ